MNPTRRAVLAASAAGVVGVAGCLGGDGTDGSDDGGSPTGDTPEPGYAPTVEDTPAERSVDTAAFDTTVVEGVEVPLAPIEDAYYWYQRREARFADARGQTQYDASHIAGAVHSPARNAGGEDDPTDGWPTDQRIVCYCGCPHHLSSIRASQLIAEGYESVFVIDEGFFAWRDRGYPLAGSEVESVPKSYRIEGRASAASAGESAWAVHEPTGQVEAGPIAADGRYELILRFADLTPTSPIVVETPDYRVERPLADLIEGTVGADGTIDGPTGEY